MKDSRDINSRIEWVFIIFSVFIAAVFIQLINLQVIKHGFFKQKAQQMHLHTLKQQVGRGTIYDREGRELAVSVKTKSICVEPRKIREKSKAVNILSSKLGVSKQFAESKVRSSRAFEYVVRKVESSVAEEIMSQNIRGIYARDEEKRFYPLGSAAAHVIGFSGTDNTGLEGAELFYEKYLRGKTGRVQIKRDAMRRPIMINSVDIKKAEAGADLYLTIDALIQAAAQEELEKTCVKYNATKGSVIVMNPENGAIYALANYPSFDPNEFEKYGSDAIRNRAVTDIFEPGSTFKIFPVSAYLKLYKDGESHKFFCGNGKQFFFDRPVHDHEKHGWLTTEEVIKYSSNIGMVEMGLKIGQEKLYKEFVNFGFGSKTGIDLPGEASGLMRHYKNWDNISMTSIPYGQEIAVTAVQLAAAYCAVANGGYAVKPHVVRKIEKNSRNIFTYRDEKKQRIIGKGEQQKMAGMLRTACEPDGTGKKAALANYQVAGKTGTAQKHNEDGKGYKKNKYNASFVGFLPADNPQMLALVVVDEPGPYIYYGGDVAAPVFASLGRRVISMLKIAPDANVAEAANIAEKENAAPDFTAGDYAMMDFRSVKKTLVDAGVRYEQVGFGKTVISQKPKAGEKLASGETVMLFLGDRLKDESIRVYMPNLKGMTIRKAIDVLSVYGIQPKCEGSGFAVTQEPKAGIAVGDKESCVVRFEMGDNT